LVAPDDVSATANALARLLGDAELARRLGDGGRRRAHGALSWDRAARAIYETMLASLEASDPGSRDEDDGRADREPPLRQ
jgi:glycosyltransferase involved in cell wall biosynthesis